MRDRVGILIALALVSGLGAAFLAFTFLRSPDTPDSLERASGAATSVVVAARDIQVGESLAQEDVRVVEWPGDALPQGYASSADEVVGRGVVVPMQANEPLLPFKLASQELGRGMTMLIPDGFRAVSVPVNDVIAVAGWVRPGTRIDVLVTLDDVRNQQEPVTQIVLQNVQVLGNDRSIQQTESGEAEGVSVVTLLLTPGEAERLAMAESHGRLQLSLRNQLDLDTVDTPGVRTSELLRGRPAPVFTGRSTPAPTQPSRVTVEVYRGPDRSESTVERSGGGG